MTTATEAVAEALFAEEIPCGACDKAAKLRSRGHENCPTPNRLVKCIPCWESWYAEVWGHLVFYRSIMCRDCGCLFGSVEAFSDYRRF